MEQNVPAGKIVKDPVCGKDVIPGQARGWDYLHDSIVYHFCGPDCRSRFQRDPKSALASGPGQLQPSPAAPTDGAQEVRRFSLRGLLKKWIM